MDNLLQGIDTVIFDLGNVLIDLDYPEVIRGFKKHATKNQDNVRKLVVNSKVLHRFETGEAGPERFRAEVNYLLGSELGEAEFEYIWNSMLKSITLKRMEYVKQAAEKYNTYVLSNTNITHELAFEQMVVAATGVPSIRDYVDYAYYSHEIGMRKPNRDIFEFVIEDIGGYASRMLFLDDRLDNVEAAKASGMKSLQIFDADKQLKELFES